MPPLSEWGGVVAVVISAAAAAAVLILNARHKNRQEASKSRQEADRDAIDQWRELHRLQQEQLDRQERHIAGQDELIADLFASDAECQVQLAQLYGAVEWIHDTLSRCVALLKTHGEDVGPLPALPPRPVRRQSTKWRTEFLARQSAQDSATLAAVSKAIQAQAPPGGP